MLYSAIIIILTATLCAILSQRHKCLISDNNLIRYSYKYFYKGWFLLSFFILAVYCFLCKSGTDIQNYVMFYQNWTFNDLSDLSFEIGDKLLFIILHFFIADPYIGLGIVKVLSLAIFFKSLYLLREKINLGFSVLTYGLLLYIFNFHLIRMMLGISLVMLGFSYELAGKKKFAVINLVFAIFFHYSAVVALLAYLFYRVLGLKLTRTKMVLIIGLFVVLYVNMGALFKFLVSSVPIFQKYNTYIEDVNIGGGIAQILLFIPIALSLLLNYRQGKKNSFYDFNFIIGIMIFFAGSLGYIYPVISRSVYYFYYFYIVFGASSFLFKDTRKLLVNNRSINLTTIIIVIAVAMQIILYFGFGNAFVSNGVERYIFIWE